ncbi:MAG: GNAT family N-acetyltransferase [Oligoflexia bacterium]|nr:GNAT family N-acetyltransferase [Oligoflexia bacterium]
MEINVWDGNIPAAGPPLFREELYKLDQLMIDQSWSVDAWNGVWQTPNNYLLATLSPIIGFALFLRSPTEKLGHLLKVVILPEYRSQGLAEKLLRTSFEVLGQQGLDRIYLEVACNNLAAIGLYHKLGMKQINYCKNFYGPQQDAYKMMLVKIVMAE